MTEQTDNARGGNALLDTAWVALAALLVLGGLAVFYGLPAQPAYVRVGAVIAGVVLGAGAFALSAHGRSLWQFVLASRVELRKVVWPTFPDTQKMTILVVVFVVIAGVFFWVVDWLLALGTRHLLGTGA
jgi:preprotein translocase subunit SecE